MSQPSFHCVANIGDATPFVHGGAFVLVDRRGTYAPELLILEVEGKDRYGDPTGWKVYTVTCGRLTAIKVYGVPVALSDNHFHVDYPAWFGSVSDIESLSAFTGENVEDNIKRALSSEPAKLASYYLDLFRYHGSANFDVEPRELNRKQAKTFCARMREQIQEAAQWRDGYLSPLCD
jgi:hypothetical protein